MLNKIFSPYGVDKQHIHHHDFTGRADDDHPQYATWEVGSGAPGSAPTRVGVFYVDGNTGFVYFSIDTSTAADWKLLPRVSWQPYAMQDGINVQNIGEIIELTSTGGGGTALIPMQLSSPMILESITTVLRRSSSNATVTWRWDLYVQDAGDDTLLKRVSQCEAAETIAILSGSNTQRTLAALTVVGLPAGLYWLALQSLDAGNHAGFRTSIDGDFSGSTHFSMQETAPATPDANGDTLDVTVGTWSRNERVWLAKLDGRVFGQGSKF